MTKIYVNLHPDYNYANIIIDGGMIPCLREYVANVDWLSWDYWSKTKMPLLRVSGNFQENGTHIKKTKIVLQRIATNISRWSCHDKAEIVIRNERNEEWQPYIFEEFFSEEEMLEEEYKIIYGNQEQELSWCKNDIGKLEEYLSWAIENGDEKDIEMIKGILKDDYERLDKLIKKEEIRILKIKYTWN